MNLIDIFIGFVAGVITTVMVPKVFAWGAAAVAWVKGKFAKAPTAGDE